MSNSHKAELSPTPHGPWESRGSAHIAESRVFTGERGKEQLTLWGALTHSTLFTALP
jgi:hypothetical protein